MITISSAENPYEDQRYLTLIWRGEITTEKDPVVPKKNRLTALNGATAVEKLLLNSALGLCAPEDPDLYKLAHELTQDFKFALYDSTGKSINPQHLPLMPGTHLTLELRYHVEAVEDNFPGKDIDHIIQRKRSSAYIQHTHEALARLGIHPNGTPPGTLTTHWSDTQSA